MSLPINYYKAEIGVFVCVIFFIWTLLTNFLWFFVSDSNFQACPKSPGKSWVSSFLAEKRQSVLVAQRYLSLLPPGKNWKKFLS